MRWPSRIDVRDLPALLARAMRGNGEGGGPLRRLFRAAARLRARRFIDVRTLMAATTHEEHIARADRYFAPVGWNTPHARKPFADPGEAAQLTRSLAVLLPHLELHPGIRLLDFGAGTCWSSMIWAYLGCNVIATDVSANALRFGEERLRADPIARDLPVTFLRFDGRRFDLPDASVDRIVGIDTLHHVLDVPATLTELSRLLAPGGIAAFSEPGPYHSLGAQAQYEMAATGVIENDIRVADIRKAARNAGFADMRVAWFSPQATLLGVDAFERRVRGGVDAADARRIVRDVAADLANIRIFFLYTPGERPLTSLSRTGLGAELSGDLRFTDGRLRGTLTARNTGRATWLPSGDQLGCVNVGVQLCTSGTLSATDLARVALSAVPVAPGETASTQIDIAIECAAGALVVDLVAEMVSWFATTGSTPMPIASTQH